MTWRDRAACADLMSTFDAAGDLTTGPNSPATVTTIETARAVCRGCPVKDECLADSMAREHNAVAYRWGIRGGLTAGERASLGRGNRPPRPQREDA